MKHLVLAGLLMTLAGTASQADDTPKKSSWLKSIGKKLLEDKPGDETPTPVMGTRGLTDQNASSSSEEPVSEISSCSTEKPSCHAVQTSSSSHKTSR